MRLRSIVTRILIGGNCTRKNRSVIPTPYVMLQITFKRKMALGYLLEEENCFGLLFLGLSLQFSELLADTLTSSDCSEKRNRKLITFIEYFVVLYCDNMRLINLNLKIQSFCFDIIALLFSWRKFRKYL